MKKLSNLNLATRLLSAGAALLLMAGAHSASAANYTWDANTGTTGIQDGNGTWSTTSTNWWNGTTNNTAVAGDALQIGVAATATTGTITLDNGGSILNYVTASGTTGVTIYANYVFKPAAAGDGLAIGNLTLMGGKTATFDAPVGTFHTGQANQDRTWTLNNGAVINLNAGGRMGVVNTNGTATLGTVNITGGTLITGFGTAGATDFSSAPNGTNNTLAASGAGAKLVINYTGGDITGYNLLGGVGGASSTGTVQFNMNSGSGTYNISGNDLTVGEGGAGKAGGDISFTVNSGIVSSTNKNLVIGGRYGFGQANGNGVFTLNSGTVNLGSGGYVYLAGGTVSNTVAVGNALNINGGLFKTGTTAGIKIGSPNALTTSAVGSTSTINIAGGETYIGTAGILANSGTTGITVGINLAGGTLGALGAWSTSYPMVLGTTGGNITFKAANDADAAFNITLNGALSGNGGFTKTGSGTLTLGAANNYSGSTTINSGTLALSGVGTLGSGTLVMGGGNLNLGATTQTLPPISALGSSGTISNGTLTGAFDVSGSGALTISAILSGTGGLTKNGAGALTLSAANTFNGGLVLNSGTLLANTSTGALGAGTLTLNGGVLDLNNSAALSFNRNTTIGGDVKIISEKDVAGAGVNYTLGTLAIGANTLSVDRGNVTSGKGQLTFGAATLSGDAIFDVGSGAALVFPTVNGNYSFTKNGDGLLALTGNTAGRTGALTVLNSGTLQIFTATALGTGTLRLNGGTLWLQRDTTVSYNSFLTDITGNTKVITDVSTVGNNGSTQILTGTARIGSSTLTVEKGGNVGGGSPTFSLGSNRLDLTGSPVFDVGTGAFLTVAALNDSGTARTITKRGVGTMTASSVATSLAAGTLVNVEGGTLVSTNAMGLGSRASVNITGGASSIFRVSASQTIAALNNSDNDSGASVDISGAYTLTIGGTDNYNGSFSGAIGGATGALTKVGTGTQVLAGNNTYAGATTIKAGALVVSGSLSASSAVTVGDTANLGTLAILGGSGKVAGNVTIGAAANNAGAKLAPHQGTASTSAGVTLTTGTLTVNSGAHLALQLGRTSAGTDSANDVSDRVQVADLTLNNADLELSLLTTTGYSLAQSDRLFLIINNGGAVNGTFASVNGVALVGNSFSLGGIDYTISYTADFVSGDLVGGNDVALYAVPEPSTWAMMLGGFGMLLGFQRMRRRASR